MDNYQRMLDVANSVTCSVPRTCIELEARMIIPQIIPWEPEQELSIQYYRCPDYPTLTVRKVNDLIETKEMISRINDGPVKIVCSIEKQYTRFEPVIWKHHIRNVQRRIICKQPLTVITCENEIFTLEVEYDSATIDNARDIINSYRIPHWPTTKPRDAYVAEFLAALISDVWYLSPKYDGEHVMIFNDSIIADNGHTTKALKPPYHFICEAERIGDKLFGIDVLRCHGQDVRDQPYEQRIKMFPSNVIPKTITPIRNHADLVASIHSDIPHDGFILTHTGDYGHTVYKSKPQPTVDLQYIRGYLYLAGETHSTRETPFELEDGKIYEFDLKLNLIRARPDKLLPNLHMPVEIDPLAAIASGKGIPSLRYHHNTVKLKLLSLLPRTTLLDIGSGLGGDLDKWEKLQFSKVYAVDPMIRLRRRTPRVTSVRARVQDVSVVSDSIALFFVPWDETLLEVLPRAQHIVMIVMHNPVSIKSELFQVTVTENQCRLQIPGTQTAEDVTETITDVSAIDKALIGYTKQKLSFPIKFGHPDEIALARMYSYLYYRRDTKNIPAQSNEGF